jgi:hypothetical protein
MILLAAWAGNADQATSILEEALTMLGNDERKYSHVSGRKVFDEHCRTLIEHPDLIQKTVDEQIETLKVGNLPTANLILR